MAGAFVALSHRGFRRYWLGALVSNTGIWMQSAAVPFVAFTLTGKAGDVGITGFFQYVPFIVMTLVGGTLADRYPRRRRRPRPGCVWHLTGGTAGGLVRSGRRVEDATVRSVARSGRSPRRGLD